MDMEFYFINFECSGRIEGSELELSVAK